MPLAEIHNKYLQNKNNGIDYFLIIFGVGAIRKVFSANEQQIINHLFSNISDANNIHIIFVDINNSYKNIQLEMWYQNLVNTLNGIWIGNDVGNQLSINIPDLSMEDRKLDFNGLAYIVSDGNYKVIKHVVEKEDDTNEK